MGLNYRENSVVEEISSVMPRKFSLLYCGTSIKNCFTCSRVSTLQIQSANSTREGSGHLQCLLFLWNKLWTAHAQIFDGLNSQIEFVEWKPVSNMKIRVILFTLSYFFFTSSNITYSHVSNVSLYLELVSSVYPDENHWTVVRLRLDLPPRASLVPSNRCVLT